MEERRSKLQHLEEHLACERYVTDDDAALGIVRIKAGDLFIREDLARSTLVFVLVGSLDISTKNIINMPVESGRMFLVTAGDSFFGRAVTQVVLFRSSFTQNIALCNKVVLKDLLKYLPSDKNREASGIVMLPIHSLLLREVELTCSLLEVGMFCMHFQQNKLDIILMELRLLYSKTELAGMFSPLLGVDNDFKSNVLQIYPEVNTVKELICELRMSPSAFKRKFHLSFGMSAKQWLIQKKKEKLLRDIVMTDCPLIELAEKYHLTVNYLTTFCKDHFGKTPTELRKKTSSP